MVGLVWFSRATDDVVECHACIAPEFHGRWATRAVIRTIYENIVNLTKCRAILGQITSPLVARIWRALGFTVYSTVAILEIKECPDGI